MLSKYYLILVNPSFLIKANRLRIISPAGQWLVSKRVFCNENLSKSPKLLNKENVVSGKYKIFKDEDADIILDVEEEKSTHRSLIDQKILEDKFAGINLERGHEGVYDIDELVGLLRQEKGIDIFVARVPVEAKYVDYMVVVSGFSKRHMSSMATFVKQVYKKKMSQQDKIPRIEGLESEDWIALDLGNIALHIMSNETRSTYDLESLWTLGPKFDSKLREEQGSLEQFLKKHSISLDDFQPVKTTS